MVVFVVTVRVLELDHCTPIDMTESSCDRSNETSPGAAVTVAKDATDNELTKTNVAKEDGLAGTFWDEDDWTLDDEQEAKRILEQAQEQCRISLTHKDNRKNDNDDARAWNLFYQQHKTNFFKDRHYLDKAFPDEFGSTHGNSTPEHRTLVEVGCGVGNTLLPLLEDDNHDDNDETDTATEHVDNHPGRSKIQWTVHGLDLSQTAIEWLQKDERFARAAENHRAMAYVYDISEPPSSLPPALHEVADVTTLLFCLSAIPPGPRMKQAAMNVAATLRPKTGVLIFRDYGRYDQAQMKLGTSRNKQRHDYDDNFYRKGDGTKCYYFTVDDVRTLFERDCGLELLELNYVRRTYRNRAQDQVRRRVWVQGRFRKKGGGACTGNQS